jgi:hypothetical protein
MYIMPLLTAHFFEKWRELQKLPANGQSIYWIFRSLSRYRPAVSRSQRDEGQNFPGQRETISSQFIPAQIIIGIHRGVVVGPSKSGIFEALVASCSGTRIEQSQIIGYHK